MVNGILAREESFLLLLQHPRRLPHCYGRLPDGPPTEFVLRRDGDLRKVRGFGRNFFAFSIPAIYNAR